MAEEKSVGAPALDTNIETGGFDEKRGQAPPTHAHKAPVAEDEEPDEDMDALIEDLESQDGHEVDEEEETQPGGGRVVPEDQLQTDSRVGLTEAEVIARRRKWGLNAMKEEQENMILKFLMFFVGPIQFVMVSISIFPLIGARTLEDRFVTPSHLTLLLFLRLLNPVSSHRDFCTILYNFLLRTGCPIIRYEATGDTGLCSVSTHFSHVASDPLHNQRSA